MQLGTGRRQAQPGPASIGFTIKHFHEKLEQRHGYKLGYTTTRIHLQKTGAVQPAPRRGAHRRKRPRRPMRGMLLHQDGSKHLWLAELPALDLIVTPSRFWGRCHQRDLLGVCGRRGRHAEQLPRAGRGGRAARSVHGALHRPRQPRLRHPRGWRQGLQDPADPGRPGAQARRSAPTTELGAGSQARGIGHLPASSPEARGRCERAFRTLQDRLPKELALAGSATVEAANRFLREVYLPEHNHRFAVPADEPAAVFVAVPEALWRDVLCLQEERRVGNDNCVRWHGRSLQIPPTPLRPHLVRATIRVHEYPDGTLAIFKGPQRLASFPPAAPATAEDLAA